MGTPEIKSSGKWENITVQNSKGVWDILAEIEKEFALPGGKTTDELLDAKAGELFDYAENNIVSNDNLWSQLPESIDREDLRAELKKLIEESK